MSGDRIRATVSYSGNVQGVGFRYTVHRLADGFNVEGYVRNTPHGEVELVAEGTAAEVEGLLAAIERHMGSYIRDRSRHDGPATGEFGDFSIRF